MSWLFERAMSASKSAYVLFATKCFPVKQQGKYHLKSQHLVGIVFNVASVTLKFPWEQKYQGSF